MNWKWLPVVLLAGTIIAIVAPIMGYFVVLRAQAFAGHALSHIGFAGATGAALLGVNALIGMFALTLLAALGIGALGERVKGRDVEIGMVLSLALGLGVLFLSLYTQYATETVGVLFGSILSVSRTNVLITLGCGVATMVLMGVMWRPLLFASIDPEVASTRGVPVRTLSMLFLVLLAITVSVADTGFPLALCRTHLRRSSCPSRGSITVDSSSIATGATTSGLPGPPTLHGNDCASSIGSALSMCSWPMTTTTIPGLRHASLPFG